MLKQKLIQTDKSFAENSQTLKIRNTSKYTKLFHFEASKYVPASF